MRPQKRPRSLGAVLAAACLLAGAAVSNAQPANDICADAAPVESGIPAAGTTVGAALDLDMAEICQLVDSADVWFMFSAPAAGAYEFSVSGSNNADLTLALVTGCDFPMGINGCATGTPTAGPRLEHQAFFPGEMVVVRVGSVGQAGQAFTLNVGPLPPPANDECAGAMPLTLGVPVATHNLSATTSVELPMAALCSSIAPGIAAGADVFFSFTPTQDGFYDFSTCGSVFDTVISVHSGCPATEANAVACNDNAPLPRCPDPFDTFSSYVSGVELSAGVTYYIRVASVLPYDSWSGELLPPGRGTFTIVALPGVPVAPPVNDECADATPIPPDGFIVGTTIGATGEEGPCGAGDVWDVWYSLTSFEAVPSVFEVNITPQTCFNNQATLSAYTACGGQLIACEAFNPLTNPRMMLVMALDPGETVLLRVAGQGGVQDDFSLLAYPAGPAAPNSDCAAAIPVSAGQNVSVNTFQAPTGPESPCGAGLTDTYALWYAFTATQTGYYRFATDLGVGVDGGSSVVVYPACGGEPLACSYLGDRLSTNPGAAATLTLNAGQSVLVRVARLYGDRSTFTFSVTGPLPPPPPVANDTCAGAVTITSMPFQDSVDITLATPDQEVCVASSEPPLATPGGIWYRYTPSVDSTLRVQASSDNPRTGFAAVFTGECGSLTQVGCPEFNTGLAPRVRLTAGTTYYILVATTLGFDTPGVDPNVIPYGTHLDVSFVAQPAPANDECAAAERIEVSSTNFTVDTLAANADAPAPSCAGFNGELADGVWYTFTTETAGTLTVTGQGNPGSGFFVAPAGALYEGSCGSLTEIACDDPTDGWFLTDRFSFTVGLEAGRTYYLAVGAWTEPQGAAIDVSFTYTGELGAACPADWDGSGTVNSADISAFLASWLASVNANDLVADFNHDGSTNSADISAFLARWIADLTDGC